MANRTLIIAEAGVNHNGDISCAMRLVDAAANAGADMVKFQTFSAERLATADTPKADYQNFTTDRKQSHISMLKQLELSPKMHEQIMDHCATRGINFFSTGFDVESLRYLESLGVRYLKIPSGEITNLPYLRRIGSFKKQLILSTGMATLGEVEKALAAVEAAGTPRSQITALHCTTEYPTPMREVNLRAMMSIRAAFGVEVGYSDHTLGIEVPIAAVALGATIIEKHLTLDRSLPGPDHKTSLEPEEFSAMVKAIRNIEEAMGDGIKRPTHSELKNKLIVRKSLVALKPIKAGECFTLDNLTAKRPGTGISPMLWDEIIGRRANRNFSPDELIEL